MGIDPVGVDENNVHSHNRYAYGNNNPYKFVDPDGRYADLAIEVVSIGAGVYSFNSNLAQGNYGDAAIDGIGVVVDGALAIVPGVPGGVGLGIKAARGSDNAVDAAKAIKNKPELIHTDPRNLIPTEKPSGSKVKRLAKDMKENGFNENHPITATRNSRGRLEIQNGHHRRDAAIKAGIEKVPVEIYK